MTRARLRLLAATGVAAAAVGALGAAPAAASSVVYRHVWHTAPSYYPGKGGRTGGYLFAGNNYFYCQASGGTSSEYKALGYHNDWWLLTDDDSHHAKVWVNAVYVSGGGNDQPIPGVPHC